MLSLTMPVPGSNGHGFGRMERRIFLEPRHDTAAGIVQRRPPAIIVIAEVEDIGGAGLDRHRLGRGDVVDIGLGDHVIDRTAQVGIIDDMRLGAADLGGKPRPIGPDARQMQAGRVDQAHRIAQLAAQAARRHRQHMHEKTRENLRICGCGWRPRRSSAQARSRPHDRAAPDGWSSKPRCRAANRRPTIGHTTAPAIDVWS